MDTKIITFNEASKELKMLYKKSFPRSERVKFKDLFRGIFEDFDFYAFYDNGKLIAFLHLFDGEEFVHLNYLAVMPELRSMGYGSKIMSWVKEKFKNKPIVLDVEIEDENSKNNEQRIRRINFYKKNGFKAGKYRFTWGKTEMHYMHLGTLSDDAFMKYIVSIFPTITKIRPNL